MAILGVLATPVAQADVLYWDTPADGYWDSGTSWFANDLGNGPTAWLPGYDANFYVNSSPTSTITVVNPVSVGAITFTGMGYTVNGNTLNLSSGNVVVSNNATINSVINGSAGLNVSGGAAADPWRRNTYSGDTNHHREQHLADCPVSFGSGSHDPVQPGSAPGTTIPNGSTINNVGSYGAAANGRTTVNGNTT